MGNGGDNGGEEMDKREYIEEATMQKICCIVK